MPAVPLLGWTALDSEADLSITAVMELLMESRSLSLADEAVCVCVVREGERKIVFNREEIELFIKKRMMSNS